MYQQQQQLQQQQRMGWPPQPGDRGGPYPQMPPGTPQEMMQRQFSYSQNFFGFEAEGEPPKRKRGRPRKNPLKEPTTAKRKYTRKKPIPPVNPGAGMPPGSAVNAQPGQPQFNNGLKNVMPPHDPTGAAASMQANLNSYDPSAVSSPSVYNFDEEEEGGVQPMRPRRVQESKKYAFGSSSDEDGSVKAAAAAAGMMAGYPPPGHPSRMGDGYPMMRPMMRPQMVPPNQHGMFMKNQHPRMNMEMHQRMMSMQQQQQQQQQMHNQQYQQAQYQQQQHRQQQQQQMQQQMQAQQPQRPPPQQQQQQQQQQPSTPHTFSENPQGEDGPIYSSEVLTKPTGGIGIKIKIKKAADDKVQAPKRTKRDDQDNIQLPTSQPSPSPQQGQQPPMPPLSQRQQQVNCSVEGSVPAMKGGPMAKDSSMSPSMQNPARSMSSQFPTSPQVPVQPNPMQKVTSSSSSNPSVMQPSASMSTSSMNMMQQQQQQQQPQQQPTGQPAPQTNHGNVRPPSNMFAGHAGQQQQQQSMQRAMQHSPMQSVPSPIRSPYSNTSPSPQHPGFGNQQQQQQQQQQQMLNNFNRFQQPNAMVPGNPAAMNNYGYGNMGNYRMQNPQFMGNDQGGGGNFYNNHYMNNGFPQGANRFGHPNGAGQYYNQMQQQQQQQNFNNGFNGATSGGAGGGVGFGNPDFPTQNNEMYQNNFVNQQNRMLPPNENNGGPGQPIPPHFRGNMNMQGSPMGSPIGPPRISPSAMHKPMPGVGT